MSLTILYFTEVILVSYKKNNGYWQLKKIAAVSKNVYTINNHL